MKILMLGGTGAMGTPLAKILADRNHSVDITTRKERESDCPNIRYLTGNAHQLDFLKDVLCQRYDAILDFMVYSPEEFQERYEQFLQSTKQYVFLSSARVYADSPVDAITEETPRLLDSINDDAFLSTNEYSLAKAREENCLISGKLKNWTIVRPYITYYDERLQLGVFEKEDWLQRALEGKPIVFSRNIATKYTTLTYGHDVAVRIADLVGNPKAIGEIYQITTSEYLKWEEVLTIYLNVLEEVLGKRPEVFITDQCDAYSQRNNHYQICYDRAYDRRFDPTKIQRDTEEHLPFMTIEQGLHRCLKAFCASGKGFAGRNWGREGALDKISSVHTKMTRIPGVKNKLRYITYRYII